MPFLVLDRDCFKGDRIKEWSCHVLHKLVRVVSEEARRVVLIIFVYTLLLGASVDAEKEESART